MNQPTTLDIIDEDLEFEATLTDEEGNNGEEGEATGLYEHFRAVADKGQELLRIDKFLLNLMPDTSRNRIQNAADAGNVWVNGKPVSSNCKVKPLDVIQVLLDHEPHDYTIHPEDIPLDVVYEDDTIADDIDLKIKVNKILTFFIVI